MPGTNVVLLREDTTFTWVTANIKGHFTIADVPAGRHTLRTKHVGYVPNEREVEVVAGKTTEVTLYVGMFVSEDDLIFSPSDAERDLGEGRIILLEDSNVVRLTQLSTECADALDRIRSEVGQELFGIEHRTVAKDDDQLFEVWVQSIRAYNDVVKAYLEDTHGEDWEEWEEWVRERTWERAWEEVPACP